MTFKPFPMRFSALLLGVSVAMPLVAAEYKIVNEGGIGRDWAAAPGSKFSAPGYPAKLAERHANVCLNIAYTLREDGIPSELEVLKAWGHDDANVPLFDDELESFIQSAAVTMLEWRFVPKEKKKLKKPTRTSSTMMFRGNAELSNADIAAKCSVPDLSAFVNNDGRNDPRQNTMRQVIQKTATDQENLKREMERLEELRRRRANQGGN